ncbi:MAG: YXWGXW repeat-containing protein [Proteobacteria bacterium]|nr:YXWGXW repeat-containing protein [Pseudomonadota bacterium]
MALRASLALAIATSFAFAAIAPQPAQAHISIGISVNFAPPMMPVYEQPVIPGPGYMWTPGYWAWDEDYGYYWVPGTWVQPPYYGALWTPGYWGWRSGAYVFFNGYWGARVGYYGGINYGYGYGGLGYQGGYWQGNNFYYNRTVNNITNVTNITNVYNQSVVNNNTTVNRYSFNGPGGTTTQATAAQLAYQNQRHTAPVAAQVQQVSAARNMPSLRASVNKGVPAIAATSRPGMFTGSAVMAAKPVAPMGNANAAAERYRPGNNATTTIRNNTMTPGSRPVVTSPMTARNAPQTPAQGLQNRSLRPPSSESYNNAAGRGAHTQPQRATAPARQVPQYDRNYDRGNVTQPERPIRQAQQYDRSYDRGNVTQPERPIRQAQQYDRSYDRGNVTQPERPIRQAPQYDRGGYQGGGMQAPRMLPQAQPRMAERPAAPPAAKPQHEKEEHGGHR